MSGIAYGVQIAHNHLFRFPATSGTTYKKHPYSVWDFTPASYSCPHEMERVGRMGDGGKWVCGMSRFVDFPRDRECVIYSFGVRDESSFGKHRPVPDECILGPIYTPSLASYWPKCELTNALLAENEMLSRTNCVVWAYDFSVVDFGEQLEPGNRERAHFLQAGIAGKTDKTKEPPFYSISDLMKMNGHEYMYVTLPPVSGNAAAY